MTVRPFLHLPPPATFGSLSDVSSYVRRMWDALYKLRKGKIECVTELTLTPNTTSTVLNYINLSPQSVVVFDPKTANAAAALYSGSLYVTAANRGNEQWTVTHANNAQTDRSFQIAVIG